MYLQYLVVFTQDAAGCCLGRGETAFQFIQVFIQVATVWEQTATWMNTTRYCKYSQVLLMMGENIARNM